MAAADDAPRLAPEILAHYREFDESSRLEAGSGPLELARTREVVLRRLPPGARDRLAALREAHRVLRPGGIAVVAAISRLASLFTGIRKGYLDDPRFFESVLDDLVTGRHRNMTADPDYFTTAFFHTPELLRAEVEGAGFSAEAPIAVEGPAWALAGFAERWSDEAWRRCYLTRLREIETERCVVEASAHVLAIGTKTG